MDKTESKINLWKVWFRVVRYGLKYKGLFSIGMLLTLLGVGFQLLTPVVLAQFFNYAQKQLSSGDTITTTLWLLTAGFILVQISQSIVHALNDYFIAKWWLYTDDLIFKKLYNHVMNLSVDFFESNPTGKVQERIWEGSQSMANILEKSFLTIIPRLIFVLMATAFLFLIKPIFGFLILGVIPIYYIVIRFYSKKLKDVITKSRELWEEVNSYTAESLFNIKTVKAFSTEDFHIKKVGDHHTKGVGVEMEWQVLSGKMRAYRQILLNLVKGVALGLGFYFVLKGEMALGSLIIVWSYVSESLEPINQMAKDIDQIQKMAMTVARSFDYLDTTPTISDHSASNKLKIKDGKIEFKDVNFRYQNRDIIKGLNLTVPAGKVLAIVGKSGSGKSTLVKLLLRFYDPQKGTITIDGQDLREVKQKTLREKIATVMQDSILFNDTIENNISYSSKKSSYKDIVRAAKISYSFDFISKLPQGFKTIVGEKGVKLSGGEQQRIGIARAVLKNSPIIVLDEATSSLDSESEIEIQKALTKLIEGKTTIIIAHRLSTVMKADIIVVMDKGKIVEQGTHADLVQHKGIYSKLFEIQSGGYLDTIDTELAGVTNEAV